LPLNNAKFEPCKTESRRCKGLGGYDHTWCKGS